MGWYNKFPDYRPRSLFRTGKIYAGQHVFEVLYYIFMSQLVGLLTHNKKWVLGSVLRE
jgi:hypothetical protein